MRTNNSSYHKPLDLGGCRALADAIGDTPETVIPVHQLRRGLCRAYVAGDPSRFDGAIVQGDSCPDEPTGFGSDPKVLWDLLKSVEGWFCINVTAEYAVGLGNIIEKETGTKVRYYGDVYHTLSRPVVRFKDEAVRQLTLDDLELLESSPKELRDSAFGNTRELLLEGFVACAIVSGRIVATALTGARTDRYGEVGVFTMEGWRRRGFSTAAASIVAQRIQEAGQTAVWSAGEDNAASLRVAEKLGFNEVSRRTYVIKDK